MLNDDEIKDFLEAQVPKNTKEKTKTDLDIFKRWMKSALPRDQRQIHEIPPNQFNQYLRSFFLTVKKQNGEEYEPESLKGLKKNSLRKKESCLE